jgi:hypothetical protein
MTNLIVSFRNLANAHKADVTETQEEVARSCTVALHLQRLIGITKC